MKLYIALLLSILICGAATSAGSAQTTSVRVRFEKDGKQIKRAFTIRFYLDEQSYQQDRGFRKSVKPKVEQGAFIVPPNLIRQEEVIVVYESSEHMLIFHHVPTSGFEATEWVVGVDTKPFERESIMETVPEKYIDYAAYLKFISKDGRPVKVLVNSHK